MKLILTSFFIMFLALPMSYAFGPTIIKKEFKCSVLADYSVYIRKISGATNSYKLLAFCLDTNDEGLESCINDQDDDTLTCFDEFNELNDLRAGDGELKINHGR